MVFAPRRFEQILADMIFRLVSRTLLSDVSDASSVKQMLAASSREDDEVYFQMTNILDAFDIDTATGDDLDARAAEIQPGTITRIGARAANGNVVFSRNGTSGTVNIATGNRVKTSDGIVFATTQTGQITPTSPEQISGHGIGRDSAPVPSVAEVPGANGNVVADTIIKFAGKPAGVDEVTNPLLTLNGRDKETDDAFRQRIKDFIASLARCTPTALETGVLGLEDLNTSQSILFSKTIEDIVNLGNATVFIDDGTGNIELSAIISATALTATYTWNGTTTVTTGDTSEIIVGDFIRLDSDGQWFEISVIVPSTDVTILNPGALSIPSGATQSSVDTNADRVTTGLLGPPPDTAVGGEKTLFLDNKPIKTAIAISLVSSLRGALVEDTDFTLNPASGQLQFSPALSTGEVLFAEYTHYTGLIQQAQRVVDGDPNDRINFPGLRAAGVLVRVLPPQVLVQTISAVLNVKEGFSQTDAISDAENAVAAYINGLGISDDVIRNEIIARIQSLNAVADVGLTLPSSNIVVLDDQLARVTVATINII